MLALIKQFIPPDLDETVGDEYERLTVVISVYFIAGIIALSVSITLAFLPFPLQHKVLACGINLVAMAGFAVGLKLMKQGVGVTTGINIFAGANLFNITCAALITGGFLVSPSLYLLMFIPVWVFLMAGREYGLFWVMVIVAVIVGFYVLHFLGVEVIQIIPSQYFAFVKLQSWLTSILLIVICLITFEHNSSAISKRLREERTQFAHQAEHDALTGLSNRKLFYHRVEAALKYAKDEESHMAIVYVDLDDFKPINDNFGHHIGDEVLKMIAQRLKDAVRLSDTVARLGGDEFAIVLHGVQNKATVKEICLNLLDSLQLPLEIGDAPITVGSSIGVAIYPGDGEDLTQLLKRADTAMYQAKNEINRLFFAANLTT